ncbi:hypothetical protein EX399_10410 [Salmonella enterica]|uniref:hypothetical protein n=1 Tax=Citrobacter braakii TaxID=57706 RepID=UPI00066B3E0B|nr:hypothetical protein [Citrobacter braakii]EAT1308186.1 hypothetical protein [Salmonella enterica]EBI7171791.1 hypothetical protein [Salmonella enterica]EJK1420424.1 hypothetical protein [Salmonella enterica]
MSKTVFLVEVEPFKVCGPETEVGKFVFERDLVEETPTHYVVTSLARSEEVVKFSRRECVAFDTRDEALLHLERIVLNKMQGLEDELGKWQHFIDSVDDELRKS